MNNLFRQPLVEIPAILLTVWLITYTTKFAGWCFRKSEPWLERHIHMSRVLRQWMPKGLAFFGRAIPIVLLVIFVRYLDASPNLPQIAKHLTITQRFVLCTSYLDQDKRGAACPQTLENAGLIMQKSGSDWYLLLANAIQDLVRQGLVEERPPTLRRDGVSSFETPLTPLGRRVVKYLEETGLAQVLH